MKSFKKACTCIGMVVGAGFASGRELTDYFLSFGDRWQAGVFISGILFFLVFYCITTIVNTKNINSCNEYLSVIMDEKTAVFTEWASGLFFLLFIFCHGFCHRSSCERGI